MLLLTLALGVTVHALDVAQAGSRSIAQVQSDRAAGVADFLVKHCDYQFTNSTCNSTVVSGLISGFNVSCGGQSLANSSATCDSVMAASRLAVCESEAGTLEVRGCG